MRKLVRKQKILDVLLKAPLWFVAMSKKQATAKRGRGRRATSPPEEDDSSQASEGASEADEESAASVLGVTLGDGDAEEVLLTELDSESQDAVIAALRAEGREEDADIAQSRVNAERRRRGTRTAELVRLDPDEDEEGIPIGGVQRKFTPPFNDLVIRDWTRKHLGGGKYEILYYGAKHAWLGRERFRVPGLPNPWRKQKKLMDENEESVRRETDQSIGVASDREQHLEDELAELRQMLVGNERKRIEEDKERRHREQIERLEAKIEAAIAGKGNTSLAETITALGTALAPVMEAMTSRLTHQDDRKGEVKELMSAVQTASEKSRESVMEIMKMNSKQSHPMDDALSKLVNTMILKQMQPQQDPQAFAFDMLKKIIPQAVKTSLDMAQNAAQPGGNDNMLERVFEMVSPFVERAMPGAASQQPAMPQGAMPQGAMPMAPVPQMPQMQMPQFPPGYGYPQTPMRALMQPAVVAQPQVVTAPQAGQWPYSQARPAAPLPQQQMQPVQQPQQPASPYVPQQPTPMAPQPMPAPPQPVVAPPPQYAPQVPHVPQAPGVEPSGVLPGQQVLPGQPVVVAPVPPSVPMPAPGMPGAPPPQHPQTNPTAAHINPNLFILMGNFITQERSGDELAEAVDDQIESVKTGQQVGPPLLSEEAISYMEQFPPEAIMMKLWDGCPSEQLAQFTDPTTGLLHQNVQDFAIEFLHYYYDDDEEEAAVAEAAAATPTPDAPVAPATDIPAPAVS